MTWEQARHPCPERNPWVPKHHPCVRSLGHPGSHRDQGEYHWLTSYGKREGQAPGRSARPGYEGYGPLVPLTPQALATAHPPPPNTRERELEAQLDQERQAHAHTRALLWRALVLGYQEGEGAQDE